MKDLLVLFGGDARGAFQHGALRYLYETGYKPDHVYGSSVGAINGLFTAAERFDLAEKFWANAAGNVKSLTASPVISESGEFRLREALKSQNWPWFRHNLFGKKIKALAHPTGLADLISEAAHWLREKDRKIDLYVSLISLKSGEYKVIRDDDFSTSIDLALAVVASASFPLVFPPVAEINTCEGPIVEAMDGGLAASAPIEMAIAQLVAYQAAGIPARITLIPIAHLGEEVKPFQGMGQILQRSLSVLLWNRYQMQMDNFWRVMTGELSEIPYRFIYAPLPSSADFYNFSEENIQRMIELGYEQARKSTWG